MRRDTQIAKKPSLYVRKVDEILVGFNEINVFQHIKQDFEAKSILSFTYKVEKYSELFFLVFQKTIFNDSFNNFHAHKIYLHW